MRGPFNLSAKERETPLNCSWSIAAEPTPLNKVATANSADSSRTKRKKKRKEGDKKKETGNGSGPLHRLPNSHIGRKKNEQNICPSVVVVEEDVLGSHQFLAHEHATCCFDRWHK